MASLRVCLLFFSKGDLRENLRLSTGSGALQPRVESGTPPKWEKVKRLGASQSKNRPAPCDGFLKLQAAHSLVPSLSNKSLPRPSRARSTDFNLVYRREQRK